MTRINTVDKLKVVARDYRKNMSILIDKENPDSFIIVKVAIATCSNAAGAKKIYSLMTDYLEKRGINAKVVKTGCMGYCYAEPTIEVTKPGCESVIFGNVDEERADEIIEKYIKNDEPVDGVIPLNFLIVENID